MAVDFTTVAAVDFEHLRELRWAWPTWAICRPEIPRQPVILFCDGVQPEGWWRKQLADFITPSVDLKVVCWSPSGAASQRHKMLSAIVTGVAEHVQTPWYVKLDTDVTAERHDTRWLQDAWTTCEPLPAFVAQPWGYTKPAAMYQSLVDWQRSHGRLGSLRTPPGEYERLDGNARHKRICSWWFVGNTAFCRQVAGYVDGPLLPVPSQDTFMWYMAESLERPYLRIRQDWGWRLGGRGMEDRCRRLLAEHGVEL